MLASIYILSDLCCISHFPELIVNAKSTQPTSWPLLVGLTIVGFMGVIMFVSLGSDFFLWYECNSVETGEGDVAPVHAVKACEG